MKNLKYGLLAHSFLTVLLLSALSVFAQAEDHKHADEETHKKDQDGKKVDNEDHKDEHAGHDDEHSDEHGDEHGEEKAEASSSVGPDKGILEASEKMGIKLSPEAIKNFGLKTLKVSAEKSISILKSAIVMTGEEKNLYRLREGSYKRIDFEVLKTQGTQLTVKSSSLQAGDEIVISGIGFLRIAEVAAFGGAEEGHSH